MRRRHLDAVLVFCSLLLLVGGSMALAERADAAWYLVPEEGLAGHLALTTDTRADTMLTVVPGQRTYWQVAASLSGSRSGDLSLAMKKTGSLLTLSGGAEIAVDVCDDEWLDVPDAPRCAPGSRRALVGRPADDFSEQSSEYLIGSLDGGRTLHLLVGIDVPLASAADPAIFSGTGRLGLRVSAVGREESADPEAGGQSAALGLTGADVLPLATAAVGLLGCGFFLTGMRRRQRG